MAKAVVSRQKNNIDFNTFDDVKDFIFSYDKELDTLSWLSNPVRPATSVDWKGELWFRVTPEDGKITGIEIEDFESVFLKKHPELAPSWNQVKKNISKNKACASTQAFGSILFSFLKNWLSNCLGEMISMMPPPSKDCCSKGHDV